MNPINTTDFEIVKLQLILKTGQIFDLRPMYQEINLFDSIFFPCLTGNILLTDAIGLISNIVFDGSEVLNLEIGKSREDYKFKQAYRIHKLSDRKSLNKTSESYVLHLISDEYILSSQQKVNRVFTNSLHSEMVRKIMEEYLGIDNKIIHPTEGIHTVQMPNLSPLDSINWIAKRCVDEKSSPNYLFFQNRYGYNFASLSRLIKNGYAFNINFNPKNITDGGGDEEFSREFLGARDMRVVSQYDVADNIKSGVYASRLVGFDPITRTVTNKDMSFRDHYGKNEHLNKVGNLAEFQNQPHISRIQSLNTNNFASRKLLYPVGYNREGSNYIKSNDKNTITFADNPDYLLERKAMMKTFLTKRVRVVMPGNFNLTTGYNVELNYQKKLSTGDLDNRDETIFGKYIIIGTRHVINYYKHETIIEVASDSNSYRNYSPVSGTVPASLLDQYGL